MEVDVGCGRWHRLCMPTDVARPKATPAKVLQDMAQLTARQLEIVIEAAAELRLQKRKRILPTRESELLHIINRGPSVEQNARLEDLQQKLRDETVTRREHAEFLGLTDELERL